jgi:hypothetical protein
MTNDTLLLRQVHPSWIQGKAISNLIFTSQTFKPTPKDKGLLSLYSEEFFTPEESYEHFTGEIGLESAGVVAISKNECDSIELTVLEDNDPFEGHRSLDFRPFMGNKSELKKKASTLKSFASARGWLYVPLDI